MLPFKKNSSDSSKPKSNDTPQSELHLFLQSGKTKSNILRVDGKDSERTKILGFLNDCQPAHQHLLAILGDGRVPITFCLKPARVDVVHDAPSFLGKKFLSKRFLRFSIPETSSYSKLSIKDDIENRLDDIEKWLLKQKNEVDFTYGIPRYISPNEFNQISSIQGGTSTVPTSAYEALRAFKPSLTEQELQRHNISRENRLQEIKSKNSGIDDDKAEKYLNDAIDGDFHLRTTDRLERVLLYHAAVQENLNPDSTKKNLNREIFDSFERCRATPNAMELELVDKASPYSNLSRDALSLILDNGNEIHQALSDSHMPEKWERVEESCLKIAKGINLLEEADYEKLCGAVYHNSAPQTEMISKVLEHCTDAVEIFRARGGSIREHLPFNKIKLDIKRWDISPKTPSPPATPPSRQRRTSTGSVTR